MLTAAMVVGVGLGTASAGQGDPCGAVTKQSTCEKGGSLRGGLYQVKLTFPDSANEVATALCKGGPSRNDRDTALADNLLQYFIAVTESDPDTDVSRLEDSKGRLVGYRASGDIATSFGTLNLYVTCIDDH